MTYRELLELYKKNVLEEGRKAEVEADIERQEAISDYLYEKTEIPELEGSFRQNGIDSIEENTAFHKEREFTKMVNRSIRRAFMKMGIAVGAVILVIVLFIQLALPEIVSSFYYNPGKEIAENTNQLSLDMAVYSELVIPLYFRDNVAVESKGYGNYDICIYQNVSYNSTFTNVSGKIEKGKLTKYDMNVLNPPTGNAFAWFQMHGDSSDSLTELVSKGQTITAAAGYASEASAALQNLTENTKYVAYVTLNKMMKYEDFMKYLNGNKDLYTVWCAVCTNGDASAKKMFQADNIGFQCTLSNSNSLNWDRDLYPNLLLWNITAIDDGNTEELRENMKNEDFMKTHFTSLLQYIAKQEKFLSMMKENADTFSDAADYVEKNGLIIYGFATIADKSKILKLNEADEVYEIYTQPLK